MTRKSILLIMVLTASSGVSYAQTSHSTHVQGKTEIDVSTESTTAEAKGENNVARNRIGVVQGNKKGDTKISVKADHVVTSVSGRNKKACTNIGGIVSDECK